MKDEASEGRIRRTDGEQPTAPARPSSLPCYASFILLLHPSAAVAHRRSEKSPITSSCRNSGPSTTTTPPRCRRAPIPDTPPPRTVSNPRPDTPDWPLSLDEAIRIALENAHVVRTLAGVTAVPSGQTIYDAAIVNTTIDQQQARFDPVLSQNNTWTRSNVPFGVFDPLNPFQSLITSTPTDAYLASSA